MPRADFGKKRGQGAVGHREFGSDPLRLDARETWDDGQDETWGFRGKVGPGGRGGSGSHADTAGLRLGEAAKGGGGGWGECRPEKEAGPGGGGRASGQAWGPDGTLALNGGGSLRSQRHDSWGK